MFLSRFLTSRCWVSRMTSSLKSNQPVCKVCTHVPYVFCPCSKCICALIITGGTERKKTIADSFTSFRPITTARPRDWVDVFSSFFFCPERRKHIHRSISRITLKVKREVFLFLLEKQQLRRFDGFR